MKKTIIAVAVVCAAAFSFGPSASADTLQVIVKPRGPVVKKVVVVRQPCYYKTVKVYKANKTVITKKRICP